MSALFRLIIIKIWLIILCFPSWFKSLIYALIIALKDDFIDIYIRIRILYLKFFKIRKFSFKGLSKRLLKRLLKSLFLFIYFIYPIYFLFYLSFYFLVLLFKYFLIFYFYFLILRKRTSFANISFYYFLKLKLYYNKLHARFILFNKMVNYDLFNFVLHLIRFIFAYTFYLIMEYIIPIILFPFKFVYNHIYVKGIEVKNYYIVKFNVFYLVYLDPLFKKFIKKLYKFWNDWSLAILEFFLNLPRNMKRSFLPKFVTSTVFFFTYYIIQISYYAGYFISFFILTLRFYSIYFINLIIYIFLNILYIIFYLFKLLMFYIFLFIYWIIFRPLPMLLSIKLIDLKILYLDFLSLIYYLKRKF